MSGKVYTYKANGKTYKVNPASDGGYMSNYERLVEDSNARAREYSKQLDKTVKQNNAQTNANYDNTARQAYIKYMQQQKILPESLQTLGVRGGATESALMQLYNNYGTAKANNEMARDAELAQNQYSRNDAWNDYNNSRLANLDNAKQQALQNQIDEYNNEVTRFSASVHQYPSTSGGYDKYIAWIKSLSKSSDPLKKIKIALVRQQMATQFPKGKPSKGGSGGGGGGRSYGGYGGYSGGGGSGGDYGSLAETAASIVAGAARSISTSKNKGSKGFYWDPRRAMR